MLRGWDKVVHFLEYAILGILLYRAMPARGFRRWLATLGIIGAAIGFLDELYQSTVPGRSASASDWLADLGGVCFGIVGCALAARARLVETGKGEYRGR